jgi:hypothetical protein
MQLLHGGTPSCRQQPTSSEIHKFLRSAPLALQVALELASSPRATSSIL